MKIVSVELVLVGPGSREGRAITVSPTGRIAQGAATRSEPRYEQILRVRTDDGLEGISSASGGYITEGVTSASLELIRHHVLGQDPLERERIFNLLHRGGRYLYQKPGWFGPLDNCLWDLAGKVAGLPIHRLLGQVREAIPAYLYPAEHLPKEELVPTMLGYLDWGREHLGVNALKVASRHGTSFDIHAYSSIRKYAGDDIALMSDPASAYALREAKEVGLALENLGYLWFEEPMFEQEMRSYKELKRGLTRIPLLSNEMLMYDMNLSAQWLIEGATDILRGNAGNGTTAVLKMAHFAELMGTTIELNSQGGLGGHVHTQLQCAILNTTYYEYSLDGAQIRTGATHAQTARDVGIVNAPEVVGGKLYPSQEPGWGAIIDWDFLEDRTIAVL